ncbi:MAG: hypothetical protein ACYCY9_03285 [Thiobacillus sp.]
MRTRFHRFLLTLLMLALPLQTFASATMLDCGFSDQASAEPMAMPDARVAGCHEPEQPDNPPAQHDCTHCAACALGSALPLPVTASVAIEPLSNRFISPPAASFSGFVPSGPERPPRHVLA